MNHDTNDITYYRSEFSVRAFEHQNVEALNVCNRTGAAVVQFTTNLDSDSTRDILQFLFSPAEIRGITVSADVNDIDELGPNPPAVRVPLVIVD